MSQKLLTGDLAQRLGLTEHQVLTLCRRGAIPFTLAGRYRLFDPADLSKIRRAAVKAGYLAAPKAAPAPPAAPIVA